MEGPRRYWVNAPFGIPDIFDSEEFEDGEERRGLKRIDAELERAGFFRGETNVENLEGSVMYIVASVELNYPRTYLDIDTGELIFYPMSQGEHRT